MELPVKNVSTCELRAVIRFLTAKGLNGNEIHTELVHIYGDKCMSVQMVRRWRTYFLEGRGEVHDEQRAGRPKTAITDDAVAAVEKIILADRRFTIDRILDSMPPEIDICRTSIHTIITDHLRYRKVCARWVPLLLSDDHKQKRLQSAGKFLDMLEDEGENVYSRIVTGDETWVHHTNPEMKRQSMVWKKSEESAPKKAKIQYSAGKVMATVFWDNEGVLLIDFLESGTTINADRYCEVLNKLKSAIKRKRPGKLSRKVLLFHDNARPHSAKKTQTLLEKFKWEIFDHPPYSPDLAPSDFFLFPKLKESLGGHHFNSNDEVKDFVKLFFKKQGTDFYKQGLSKLQNRYKKCIQVQGDYVEK